MPPLEKDAACRAWNREAISGYFSVLIFTTFRLFLWGASGWRQVRGQWGAAPPELDSVGSVASRAATALESVLNVGEDG